MPLRSCCNLTSAAGSCALYFCSLPTRKAACPARLTLATSMQCSVMQSVEPTGFCRQHHATASESRPCSGSQHISCLRFICAHNMACTPQLDLAQNAHASPLAWQQCPHLQRSGGKLGPPGVTNMRRVPLLPPLISCHIRQLPWAGRAPVQSSH